MFGIALLIFVTVCSSIGMMDGAVGATLKQRHVERTQHEFGVQMIRSGPADNTATEHVEHHRQIKESFGGQLPKKTLQ